MSEAFNYRMSTQYQPEFQKLLTYEKLYNTINEERKNTEPDTFNAREIFERRDCSGILNKLKKLLKFDLKSYGINDEEKYNVLKLMYFLINTNKYTDENKREKTVSIIDLMTKHSMEHTDAHNAIYEEHFRNCINVLRQGVHDPDKIENEFEKIHKQWLHLRIQLHRVVLTEVCLPADNLKTTKNNLRSFAAKPDINKMPISNMHNDSNESVIDIFYNMMLSSRMIAEIEDNLKVVPDTSYEKNITAHIRALAMNDFFSQNISWEAFSEMICTDAVNLNDKSSKMIWSLLLIKENISSEDIENIVQADFNFAKKYAPVVAEYWIKFKNETSILNWILVMQELMFINNKKISYSDKYIRHSNGNPTLTAAIKHFHKSSELPKQILLERLTIRTYLMLCLEESPQDWVEADRYLLKIEKSIFQYKNINSIKNAHLFLYPNTLSCLRDKFHILYTQSRSSHYYIQKLRCNYSAIPALDIDDAICSLLSADQAYRLANNKEFIKIKQEGFRCICSIKGDNSGYDNLKKVIDLYCSVPLPETAIDILCNNLCNEFESLYGILKKSPYNYAYSQTFSIPIYLGEGLEYICYMRCSLNVQSNRLKVSCFKFLPKNHPLIFKFYES